MASSSLTLTSLKLSSPHLLPLLLLIPLLPTLVWSAPDSEVTLDLSSMVTPNKRLNVPAYHTFVGRGLRWCATECKRSRQKCLSFNYIKSTLTCQLMDRTSSQASLVTTAGTLFGHPAAWPHDILGPCAGAECSLNYRCETNGTNQATCQPAVCGTAPSVANARTTGTLYTVGQTLTYTCTHARFPILHPPAHVTCNCQGHWTTPTFTCQPACSSSFPSVLHSTRNGTSTSVGSVLTYTCVEDYLLVNGPATVTCDPTGTWTAPAFTCKAPYSSSLSGNQGTIYSPEYPHMYGNNYQPVTITVTLSLSTTQSVQVIGPYNIAGSAPCSTGDYVIINRDGTRYCGLGLTINKTFTITGRVWYLDFYTDSSGGYAKGFKFTYSLA